MNQDSQIQGIFVSGLPVYCCKHKLTEVFSSFGEVKFVRIFSKKQGKKTQSFAKIKFTNIESVFACLQNPQPLYYQDKQMALSELKTQSKIEQSIYNSKSILFIENLPDKPSKPEISLFLSSKGVPVKKVVRIIKKKPTPNKSESGESGESCKDA